MRQVIKNLPDLAQIVKFYHKNGYAVVPNVISSLEC